MFFPLSLSFFSSPFVFCLLLFSSLPLSFYYLFSLSFLSSHLFFLPSLRSLLSFTSLSTSLSSHASPSLSLPLSLSSSLSLSFPFLSLFPFSRFLFFSLSSLLSVFPFYFSLLKFFLSFSFLHFSSHSPIFFLFSHLLLPPLFYPRLAFLTTLTGTNKHESPSGRN